jgi:recombination protein RecT
MASNAVAERRDNPVAVIRQTLTQMAPEFKAALPAHVSEEKFRRVAMTAIQNNPDLQNADRRSLFGAIVRLAQDGLLPDGREAALVMFGNKAQAMPMIAGVLKKVRQSGEVAKVSAQVVYEHDHFLVRYGFDEDVEHVPPTLDKPRGKPIGAYATAVLKNGEKLLEVMSLEEIEKVRAVSRSGRNGPWAQWWGEMARKTVMRRLSKRLPMSTDLEEEIFQRDATMNGGATPELTVVENEQPQLAEPMSRLDALEAHIEDAEIAEEGPADTQRGENFTDDADAPVWQTCADTIRSMIDAAIGQASWEAASAELDKHDSALPGPVAEELAELLAAKKAELAH